MYSEQNRAFNYAVLASIVLHGLLLFGISQRERSGPAEPQVPIIARLVEPPARAPAALAEPPQAEPPQAVPVKPRPRPKPAAPKPAAPEAAPLEPRASELETAPPVPAAPPVVAEAEPPSVAAAPPGAEAVADPGSLAQYRLQLIAVAPRYKHYPSVARDNNWEGTVALRMVVSPNGRVASLSVTKSSGYDVLDQQALQMFRKAAATVPVPPVLRGKEFAVEVAATYFFTD
jgi:protein TonB